MKTPPRNELKLKLNITHFLRTFLEPNAQIHQHELPIS